MSGGKHEILEETRPIIAPEEAMGWPFLRRVLIGVAVALGIVFPKIFITTQIYYKSREISTLTHEHDALLEENRLIRAKVEALRYKNQIQDTLF